jgi:hypothetical protein
MAHFGMSYVLRYAGLQDQAGKECDAALALDPGFNGFRSCANPFILLGDYAHAQRYIALDAGFGALMRMRIAIHTGNGTAALAESNTATQLGFRNMSRFQPFLRACVNHDPKVNFDADPVAERDAELLFQNAELLGWCGQGNAALRELRKAIKGGHCSYPAINTDSLFDSIRQRPEFGELRQAAIQCQQDFVTHRQQVDAAAVRQ